MEKLWRVPRNRANQDTLYRFASLVPILMLAWTVPLYAEDCLSRDVPVSVTTQDGRPVADLTAASFSAEFHGKAVSITDAIFDTSPHRVILVLDASGSMTEQTRTWKSVIALAKHLGNSLPPSVSLTLLPFSSRPGGTYGGLDGRKQVLSVLDQFESFDWRKVKARRTALIDAIKSAAEHLKPSRFGDSIVVITDGDDNASMENEGALERFLLTSGIRVFAFAPGFGQYRPGSLLKEPGSTLIKEVTSLTGGEWMTIDMGYEDKIAEGVERKLAGFYRIKIDLPELVTKVRTWKLTVTPREPSRARLRVKIPERLAPCS